MEHLASVPGIALLDRYHREPHADTAFMLPYAADFRDAGKPQRLPNRCAARNRLEHHRFVNWTMLWSVAQDRVVAMQDRLDAHDRALDRLAAVIPRPFAERSLFHIVAL